MDKDALKKRLDALYRGYDFKGRIEHDPIRIPMRFKRKRDVEAAALLASAFAYGSVEVFLPVLDRVISAMGESPSDFMRGFDAGSEKLLGRMSYRFYKAGDIACIIRAVGAVINRHGSIERAFMAHYSEADPDVGPALSGLADEIRGAVPACGRRKGFMFAFPSPESGSPCKRLNLFLRWMVRDRDTDFGLWKGVPPSKLVIPLDTHIGRVSRCLGFTKRKTNDWKTAVEITEALKKFDARDPLKYDFALCHRGIAGLCGENRCKECELWKN